MLRSIATTALLLTLALLRPQFALAAGDFVEDPSTNSTSGDSSDSTFDPFSDYSEFEEGSEEEADVNFFHNGRFFSIGLLGGYESFTQTLGIIYQPNFHYEIFINYFFDLKLAMQLGYGSSSHPYAISTESATVNGNVTLNHFDFSMKYYLNTQNVTRGLAALNPYLIGGAAYYSRNTSYGTITINSVVQNPINANVNDSALGLQAGIGIEIPIIHNGAFFGLQASYSYIAFPDANTQIVVQGVPQGLEPNGGAIDLDGIIGVSF